MLQRDLLQWVVSGRILRSCLCVERDRQPRGDGQQVVAPCQERVDVLLQSLVLLTQLLQARQQRGNVKVGSLFHEKLGPFIPLPLQQLFNTGGERLHGMVGSV